MATMALDEAGIVGNPARVLFLGGEVRVEDGYVFVRNESVPDVRRAREVLEAVDRALVVGRVRAVMFDTRDMAAPDESVNTILRGWVDACGHHDKVALLVRSDLKRIASNMRALSVGVKMRSFHDRGEAVAWLRKPLARAKAGGAAEPRDDATPEPRERPVTEPMDLPPYISPRAVSGERRQPPTPVSADKRRWQSPLLQGLNDD